MPADGVPSGREGREEFFCLTNAAKALPRCEVQCRECLAGCPPRPVPVPFTHEEAVAFVAEMLADGWLARFGPAPVEQARRLDAYLAALPAGRGSEVSELLSKRVEYALRLHSHRPGPPLANVAVVFYAHKDDADQEVRWCEIATLDEFRALLGRGREGAV